MQEYVTLLRQYPQYRTLWIARLVSNLGDWFNLLASAQLISSLTNSGAAVSGLFLARFLPTFFTTPFAGVLADRVSRRTIMLTTDLLRAATVLCFLLIRDADQIWLFYVLTALQFILSALYTPAHSSIIANVVPAEKLVAANTLDALSWSLMLSVGALLGGVAAAVLGVQAAFVLDAATFLVSAWFVSRIHMVYSDPIARDARAANTGNQGFADLRAGMDYLRQRPYLLAIASVKAGGALIWGAVNVLEIPMANTTFPLRGSGTLTLGLIYALIGLGTFFGPMLVRRVVGDTPHGLLRGIGISYVIFVLGVLVIGIAPSLFWLLFAISMRGLGSGALWVFSSVLLQIFVEDRFRGRVFAFELAMLTLAESLSTIYGGLAMDRWGLDPQRASLYIGFAAIVVTALWYGFQRRAQSAVAQGHSFSTARVRALPAD